MINAERLVNCPDCTGDGKIRVLCAMCEGTGRQECHECWGKGRVETPAFHQNDWMDCPHCHGTGVENHCLSCASRGYDLVRCETCGGIGELPYNKASSIVENREREKQREVEQQRKNEEESKRIQVEAQRKWEAEAPVREAQQREEGRQRRVEAESSERNARERQQVEKRQTGIGMLLDTIPGVTVGIYFGVQESTFHGQTFGIGGFMLGVVIGIFAGLCVRIYANSQYETSESIKDNVIMGLRTGALAGGIIMAYSTYLTEQKQNTPLLVIIVAIIPLAGLAMVFTGAIGGFIGAITGAIKKSIGKPSNAARSQTRTSNATRSQTRTGWQAFLWGKEPWK